MKAITVFASTEYPVLIGRGLLENAARYLRSVTDAATVCIVSDHTVWALYGDALKDTLTDAGYRTIGFTFPAGEQSKSLKTYGRLLEFLAESNVTRSDCIIALGGGVVGDLAGFAAATYLRGIDLIQIPTTLLAMVDSSVGGKTAIDLSAGKNLAGAFYQPKLVLCDTDTLATLPEAVFRDGCAEVIKYGILFDRELFDPLLHSGLSFEKEPVIARCVELKQDVVAADEFDRGQRMLLNLGHTLGHGIEAVSGYTVSHGRAVAMGIAIIANSCAAKGICSKDTAQAISDALNRFALPTATELPATAVCQAALSDKKRSADTIRLIVPKAIGSCEILPLPAEELISFVKAGM